MKMIKQTLKGWKRVGFVLGICVMLIFPNCETNLDDDTGGSDSDSKIQEIIFGAAPAAIVVTPQNGALLVQWTRLAAMQQIVADYEVYYSASPEPETASKIDASGSESTSQLIRVSIPNLENHVLYYVWVRGSYKNRGKTGYSPMESGMPIPPPVTPGTISVTPGENMLELKWTAVPDAASYRIFFTKGSSNTAAPPDSATMAPPVSAAGGILSNLDNNSSYTLWVQAVNTSGESPGYSRAGGTPAASTSTPANPPTIKTVIPGNQKLVLTWDQVSGVPRYTVFYSMTNNSSAATQFPDPIPADSPTVTAEISGLQNDKLYYVWVKSTNEKGSSSFSAERTGTPVGQAPINWNNSNFVLGRATGEYPFAQDVPESRFFAAVNAKGVDRLTRVQETALGDLFTDAAVWYARNKLGVNVDFAFLNGGYIEGSLSIGQITLSRLAGIVQPTGRGTDKIVIIKIKGSNLKTFFGVTGNTSNEYKTVEGSVASIIHMGRGGGGTGDFGMVSKEMRYTIEYPRSPGGTSPLFPGSGGGSGGAGTGAPGTVADDYWHGRIKAGTLKFNGGDIDDNKMYTIITSSYTVGVTSAYNEEILWSKIDTANKAAHDILFYYAVAEYIYDKQTIAPYLDGRIKLEGGVPLPPPWVNSSWNPWNH